MERESTKGDWVEISTDLGKALVPKRDARGLIWRGHIRNLLKPHARAPQTRVVENRTTLQDVGGIQNDR